MISTWTAVGIGVACFFLGGTLGVLAVSITAISKNDFGRDDGTMVPESHPEPEQLTMLQTTAETIRRSRLLNAKKAARKIGMSPRWLYDNADSLPFTVRFGRSVRFKSGELDDWLRTRKAGKR